MLRGKIVFVCVESVYIFRGTQKMFGEMFGLPGSGLKWAVTCRVSSVLLSAFFSCKLFNLLTPASSRQQAAAASATICCCWVDVFFSFSSLTLELLLLQHDSDANRMVRAYVFFWESDGENKKRRACFVLFAVVVVITSNECLCWWMNIEYVHSYTPKMRFFKLIIRFSFLICQIKSHYFRS